MNASLKIYLFKLRWFLHEKITFTWDFILYTLKFPISDLKNIEERSKGKKIIVYVGEQLPPRIPRIAKHLKYYESGHFMILICHERGFIEKFTDPCFDETVVFHNAYHLRRIMRQIPKIYLVHAFAPKSFFPSVVLRYFKYPFLIDMQDVLVNYYGRNPVLRWIENELPSEKFCLEHATGIVAHSLETNSGIRAFEINKKPKSIFFPLYCDNDMFCENNKILAPDNIHVVYSGGVAGSHRNPEQYGNIQHHWLIEKFSEQKIHFHIYPSPSNLRADYEEYEVIAKNSEYFHFHQSVAQNQLAKEISKYHFGIIPFFWGDSSQTRDKYKYCTTLKFFNYMEAGLPIIVSKDKEFPSWLTERYGFGITLSKQTMDNIRQTILLRDYRKLVFHLEESRSKLSLRTHINRLSAFYSTSHVEYEKKSFSIK